MNVIYTIGYTAFKIEEFVDVLNENRISCVIDVRSSPISIHYPEYNKRIIQGTLKKHNIEYRNYAFEFGARQTDTQFYSTNGYLDFNKYVCSQSFNEGYKKILAGIDKNYIFALMCAEKDPINCHRAIMIGHEFNKRGFIVKNILYNKNIETQEEIDMRLLDIYFPDRDQLTLFGSNENENELIDCSYKKRNAEIGYKLKDE
jgi:uncharacterized protein (DUF488 family)